MPLAFSVHNFISSVGADAGFAAIIGLAVLVLLYFAHARETANLREEAALLAARLQQAEARVAELSRPQPVGAAVPSAEGVQVTDRRAAGSLAAAVPFAPAGVAAPALAAATRVVPLPEPEAEPEAAPSPPPEPQPAVAMAAAKPAAVASPGTTPAPTEQPSPVAAAAAPAPPTNAQPTAEPASPAKPLPAAGPGPTAIPGPATAAAGNGAGRGSSASITPPPSASRAPLAGRGLPPLGAPAKGDTSFGRRIAIGIGALALLAAAAVALVLITGSSGSSRKPAGASRTTNAPAPNHTAAAFIPAAVTVAVLNGTATNQLAHHVASRLATDGYKEGRIATAANQTQSKTIVAFLPGAKNRTDALHVATTLNLKPTVVQPIDAGTQQVACPPPAACTANVVVTVGADLATF